MVVGQPIYIIVAQVALVNKNLPFECIDGHHYRLRNDEEIALALTGRLHDKDECDVSVSYRIATAIDLITSNKVLWFEDCCDAHQHIKNVASSCMRTVLQV